MARGAGLGRPRFLEAEGVATVAGAAAVADLEARRVDVLVLRVAPISGVGGPRLRMAGVAPHLHDLARHLPVVRYADVPLPVAPEPARSGTVRVSQVEHVLLVDLLVAGAAGRLRHPTVGRHDLVVVGAVAVGAGELGHGEPHARILDTRPAHGAGRELAHDHGIDQRVAGRAAPGDEDAVGDIGAESRGRWRDLLEILVDLPGLGVADRLGGEAGHDAARAPEPLDQRLWAERRVGERGTDATPAAGAVTAQAALGEIECCPALGVGAGRGGGAEHQQRHEQSEPDHHRGPAPSQHRAGLELLPTTVPAVSPRGSQPARRVPAG